MSARRTRSPDQEARGPAPELALASPKARAPRGSGCCQRWPPRPSSAPDNQRAGHARADLRPRVARPADPPRGPAPRSAGAGDRSPGSAAAGYETPAAPAPSSPACRPEREPSRPAVCAPRRAHDRPAAGTTARRHRTRPSLASAPPPAGVRGSCHVAQGRRSPRRLAAPGPRASHQNPAPAPCQTDPRAHSLATAPHGASAPGDPRAPDGGRGPSPRRSAQRCAQRRPGSAPRGSAYA
jgi:hypothetical protein